jgi:hypothetical protein
MLIRLTEFLLVFAGIWFAFTQILIPAIRGRILFPYLRPDAFKAEQSLMEARHHKIEAALEYLAAKAEAEAVKIENKTEEILEKIENGDKKDGV